VVFRWDLYKGNLLSILNIRQGGLAIYGGVIAAIITTFVFSKVRKIPFGRLCDTAGLGLILGQIIGRWGNFFNREAFGDYTNNLLAMQLPVSAVRSSDLTEELLSHTTTINGVTYIQVHPTFLYESLWNLLLLILLLLFFNKRKFEGEVFLWYLLGYGIGRFWIEALRTDQLLIPGIGYPVSRVVAVVCAVTAAAWIAVGRWKKR
jgi:phosphatidylglycerol:prolipoprotein diacylglycerol transferase